MLRYSSQAFTFHLLPGAKPPGTSAASFNHHKETPTDQTHALWEGFGTLALVNKGQGTDRAMILEVRPPEVVDGNVLREFAKGRREWWHLPGELCVGDAGQANLLQAQVSPEADDQPLRCFRFESHEG